MRANRVDESRIALIGALFVALALAPAARPQTTPSPPEQPLRSLQSDLPVVVSARIVTQQGRILAESPPAIAVQPGKSATRDEVAQSMRTLYKTGDYADIRVVEDPVPGGVRLDFVVQENLFFNQVEIQGLTPPPSDSSAVAAMQIGLGEIYRAETVSDGLSRLAAMLNDDGLYEAKLRSETVPHAETHQMDILVHVDPGPRARISAVQLANNTEFTDFAILSRLKLKPGDELTSDRLQRATARIRKFLVKKGHLSGRATVKRGDYQSASHAIPLSIEVSAGPLVKVVIEGASFSKGDLKTLLPIYQEGAVDSDLLDEGKRNLLERLEREGYFDAKVDYRTATTEVQAKEGKKPQSEEVITYKVDRGDRHTLVGIGISGNKYFNTGLLKSRLQIFPSSFASRGRFSMRLAEDDRQSMENLYRSNGFLSATVQTKVQDNYQNKIGNLYVQFVVDEGGQTRVASLDVSGNHSFSKDTILGVVALSPGQPYSDFNVATDRANILALYFNEGFPEATVTATAEPVSAQTPADSRPSATKPVAKDTNPPAAPPAPPEMRVSYLIDEGPQTRVDRIFITGFRHTREGIIRRQVEVKPGQPLRAGDVVNTQRRLYNLGVFNRVTVAPQNPTGTDPNKDVVVQVEEAKRYTIAYGGGFEAQRLASTTNPTGGELQASPRGIFEVSKLNLTGRADSLSLKLRGSTIQGRALLAYSAPNTFTDPHLSFQATAYAEKTQDINTFSENRYEVSVQLTDQFSSRTAFLYHYSFRKIVVSNLNIPPEEIPLFQQPTLVSEFGLTWVRDTRDNPADATRGTFNTADFGVADTYIGSSASFLRFLYQNASYYPIKRNFSFARSIRIGILEPYRDTVSLAFPAVTTSPLPQLIPLPERFFAGGGTSLRGFALNQAGPRDSVTGFPVGGQALLVLNQEFRFPMKLPWVGSRLGGTLFYDAGNVYSKLSRITLRWSSAKPSFDNSSAPQCQFNCTNELNYLSHTIGFGFRYATPVGPIRVDLGYQLNRPFFVVPIPCPSNTPSCTTGSLGFQATQLPRFQVFFNLGSTF